MIHTSLEQKIEQEVFEIEKHLHHYEKFFGLAGTPAGETHRADRITLLPEPFQLDAGNDTWGAWLQIFGSDDTPVIATNVFFDFNKILIVSHEHNTNVYALQLAYGESTELAAKLTAENFGDDMIVTGAGNSETGPTDIDSMRVPAGQKVWLRIWAKGQNTGTLDVYPGIHEYVR